MTKTGAQILWECLEREGVKHVFGYPGGAILPAYDALKHSDIHHILVRHEQGATHMADGYARQRAGGRRGRDLGPGGNQHGYRHRHRDDGFLSHRLHHGTGGQQADRLGCFSRNRYHRHHAPHHQAQLPGHSPGRPGSDLARGILCGAFRPSRTGSGRHYQGRAAVLLRVRLGSGQAPTAGLPSRFIPGRIRVRAGARSNPQGQAPGDSRRARHHRLGRHEGGPDPGGKGGYSGGADPARAGIVSPHRIR